MKWKKARKKTQEKEEGTDMIAIVIILILSSIIGGIINDHITFYGSPWSVKMQKKKAYLIVFMILWVGMSSIQMFQDAENDGTEKKTEQSQETQNDDSDYSDLEDDIGWSYDDTDADYGDTEADYDDQDEEYDDSEDADGNTLEDKNVSQKKYILPMSSKRKLKEKDLKKLGAKKLRIARNEIYARHGRMFQDQELQDYFDRKDWYTPSIAPEDFSDAVELSKLERRNIAFIRKHE
jgi:hypothetical protein